MKLKNIMKCDKEIIRITEHLMLEIHKCEKFLEKISIVNEETRYDFWYKGKVKAEHKLELIATFAKNICHSS